MLFSARLLTSLLLITEYSKSNTGFYGVDATASTCASWCGDPHFHTFDNLRYDCQGAGEFVVLKDFLGVTDFEIRGRFQHIEGETEGVTVTRGVAFNNANGKKVSLTLRDETSSGTCASKVRANGVEVLASDYLEIINQNTYELETDNGATLKITSRNAGKFGCYYCVRVCVTDEMKPNIVGLLGSPNNDINDDWMDEYSNPLSVPVGEPMKLLFNDAYDYCVDNWCVLDESDSMFTYPLEHTVYEERAYTSGSFEIMNQSGGEKPLSEQLGTSISTGKGTFTLSNEPVPNGMTGPIIQYEKSEAGGGNWQWLGWDEDFINKSRYVIVSLWIKFEDVVPPSSPNFGLKIHGNLNNAWVDDMEPNKWKFISACAQNTYGDYGHSLLIFDSVHQPITVLIADMKLEVRDTCTPNRDFDYYNKCAVPFDTSTSELFENADQTIKDACNNDAECIIETLQGGEEEANTFQGAEQELIDENYNGGGVKTRSTVCPAEADISGDCTLFMPGLECAYGRECCQRPDENGVCGEEECDDSLVCTCEGNSWVCLAIDFCLGASSCEGGNNGGGVKGDPHFKTWDGQPYDFHGICDLVLLHTPDFMNGVGMDIHIRSTKTRQWSYISRAVVKIGIETFEVATGKDRNSVKDEYFINGISGKDDNSLQKENMMLPNTISGYKIQYRSINSKQKEYIIDLGNGETLGLYTWKHMIRIELQGCKAKNFKSSVGLMGTFANSHKVGRDNTTTFEDLNIFGQEWQVLPSEGNLFQTVEGPQAPSKCEIPSKNQLRRRLSQSEVTMEEAELACARVTNKDDFNLCVFDVIATGDVDSVGVY